MVQEESDWRSFLTFISIRTTRQYEWKNPYTDESKSNDELDINPWEKQLDSTLNVDAKEYKPKRATAAIAKLRISDMAASENIETYVE